MPREEHAAKNWVEENFPRWQGNSKAALILAYGAGLDRGLAEAQELLEEELKHFRERKADHEHHG